MIRTVTLNTGFDEVLVVTKPDEGGVADIIERSTVPSGKGINCARVVRALGSEVTAYGLIGADAHALFDSALDAEGIGRRFTVVAAPTRTNLTIRSQGAEMAAHYRAPGFSLESEHAIDDVIQALAEDVRDGDIVSLHGSIPNGASVDTWHRIGDTARSRGAVLLVDVYGRALLQILNDGPIAACKPNEQEISVLPDVNSRAKDDRAVVALRYMAAHRVWLPMVSLGASGIAFAIDKMVWRAQLAAELPRLRVGAGDACMAGMTVAFANGETRPRELVRCGIAVAVAHVEATVRSALGARARMIAPRVRFEIAGEL